jgi:hypothetical protein
MELFVARMTLNALKHRDIAEIHWVFEGLVSPMAGFTFAIGQAAEVNRTLE